MTGREFYTFYIPIRELLWRRLWPVGKKASPPQKPLVILVILSISTFRFGEIILNVNLLYFRLQKLHCAIFETKPLLSWLSTPKERQQCHYYIRSQVFSIHCMASVIFIFMMYKTWIQSTENNDNLKGVSFLFHFFFSIKICVFVH